MSDFTRIKDNVQKMVDQGAPSEDIDGYLGTEGFKANEFKTAVENYGTFMSAVKRGGKNVSSLVADWIPIMGATALEKVAPESWIPNIEAYKQRQMGEAIQTQEEIAKKYPAAFESYKEVTSPLEALGYAKEAVGEALPSIAPSVLTGGITGIAGRGAAAKAAQVAGEAAKQGVLTRGKQAAAAGVPGAAEEFVSGITGQRAAQAATTAAQKAAFRTGLGYEAAGAMAGSALLNIPEAYQSIYSSTGQEALLPAFVSGSFNAVLDSITPISMLRTARGKGLTNEAIIGAWYKRGAKELGKGVLTEGTTEAIQEMSNAAAEKFVDENKTFFTPENLTRFIDAGLRGGIGGGVIQGGLGVAMGKAAPTAPPAPKYAPLPPLEPGFGQPKELPTVAAGPAPFTPLEPEVAGAAGPSQGPARDIAGVVPTERFAAPTEQMQPVFDKDGKVVGYEPVPPEARGPELTGEQAELPLPGQVEMFPGKIPEPLEPKPEEPLVNYKGEPVQAPETKEIPDFLKDLVNDAKKRTAPSSIFKLNNPATAKVVAERIAASREGGMDDIQAMEKLYSDVTEGRAKSLSEPQQELLEAAYKRKTGNDIAEAIENRRFREAQQAGLFPGEEAAPAPAPAAAPTPTRTPEVAWNRHKNDDHPAYADLSDEERAAWDSWVNRGRDNAVNFEDVVADYEERMHRESVRSPEEIKAAMKDYEAQMLVDIESDIKGKSFAEVLKFLTLNGPQANREIAQKILQRYKEMHAAGYQFKFAVADTPARVRVLGGYSGSGVSGRVMPDYYNKKMDVSVAGRNSGQPFGAQFRTLTHEALHAVTSAIVDYASKRAGSKAHKLVKELQQLYNHVYKFLKNKEATAPETLTEFEKRALAGYNNALGNMTKTGRRYNELHEIMSWGTTDSGMLESLENIPYKRTSALQAFVEIVRKLLGLAPKADTALTELLTLTKQVMEVPISELAERGVGPVEGRVIGEEVAAPTPTPTAPQPSRLTKLQPAPTTGQQVQDTVQKAKDAFAGDWWTKFRIAAVDPTSGLAKTLSSLPIFQNGRLRADMLLRSFNQVINLIKNGLQSGIPVLNADGSVVIERSENNLRRSQLMADALDTNPTVQASGMSGRAYVGEVARILRGEEIMKIDEERRRVAKIKLAEAAAELKQAYAAYRQGSISRTALNKIQSYSKAVQKRYKPDLNLNREKQVKDSHISWAYDQLRMVPEVESIFEVWHDINTRLVDLWQQTGLLTAEHADNLKKQTRYVPLYASRVDLLQEEQETYTGKATGTKTVAEIDRLEGSELVRNIWENMDKHYAFMTAKAFQNQTRKVAVEQLMSAGIEAARYAENVDDANLRYKDPSNPNADANGVVHIIVDNPNDVVAFQMMHYELNPIMKGFSATTQLLRAGALINPMYWIKQLIRDPIHAAIAGNLNEIITPFHAAKEYLQILANNSEEARILAERGVIGQIDPTIDLHDFLKQVGTEKLSPSMVDKWSHKIMRMHEASDAATRVSIFKAEKAAALKQGMSEQEATDYAVHKARESINFSVRGNSKTLNALRHMIPFFSAAITSLDTLYRSATGYGLNPEEKKIAQTLFAKRAAMMVVLSSAYAMMMQDDDDYKKLPDNVKDNNWLLPSPVGSEHTFIKIPVPFEVGFLFKTLPEGAIRYMADTSTGKEVLASYTQGLLRNLPGEGVMIPQAAKPALEAITNYSFFTGRPIEGMSDQGLPVAERGPNASEIAKVLSKMGLDKVSLSPARIDHLTQGYFAEMGTFFAGVSSNMITAAEGKTPPTKNIEESPFFKNFLTNPNTSDAATDFYDIMQNSQETVNAFNRLKKTGRLEEAQEMLSDEEKRKLIAAAPSLRKIQEQMSKIRENITLYKNKYDMDPDLRRDKINELQTMYDRVAKQGYKVLEAAGIER